MDLALHLFRGPRKSLSRARPQDLPHSPRCPAITIKQTGKLRPTRLAALERLRFSSRRTLTRNQGRPPLSPLRGQETFGPAQPPSLFPSRPLPEDVSRPPSPGKSGLAFLQPRASASWFPALPGAAGCSQWARGAFRPQPIRRQMSARVAAGPARSPALRGPLGPPGSVSGATCARWDWLAPRREGRRLAVEDGPIPRASGLARAGVSWLLCGFACGFGAEPGVHGQLVVKRLCEAAGRNYK